MALAFRVEQSSVESICAVINVVNSFALLLIFKLIPEKSVNIVERHSETTDFSFHLVQNF